MGKKYFYGSSVSEGIGIGGIYVCKTPEIIIRAEHIEPEEVEMEITNLEVAVCKTYIEIYDLYEGFAHTLSKEEQGILDVYNAILDDLVFFDEMKETVEKTFVTAESAINSCMNKYISEIENSDNDYVKQRLADLNDLKNRLIRNIFANDFVVNYDEIKASHIVVVREINPTLAVTLGKKKVQGVIVQEGAGYLSHSSIILRGSGIPTINGVGYREMKYYEGNLAVVDGFEGTVLIEPDDPEIERYKEIFKIDLQRKEESPEEENMPVQTLDGHKVDIYANISNLDDFKYIRNKSLDGIGLVRTETVFIRMKKLPEELRQFVVYASIAKGMGGRPVIIRTVDIGGDKTPDGYISLEDLKGLSNRGIHWSLNHPEDFKMQLRAILKAANRGQVKISLPMVENVHEIAETKRMLEEARQELILRGDIVPEYIDLGAVIETREAVQNISEIVKVVDFISIGTNDLLNQTMGLSRKLADSRIREYFEPRFLTILRDVIRTAKEQNIRVSICGEMSADPMATVLLVGMGTDDLSVAPPALPIVKRTIRDLYYEISKELLERVLQCKDIDEVMHELSGFLDCRF